MGGQEHTVVHSQTPDLPPSSLSKSPRVVPLDILYIPKWVEGESTLGVLPAIKPMLQEVKQRLLHHVGYLSSRG